MLIRLSLLSRDAGGVDKLHRHLQQLVDDPLVSLVMDVAGRSHGLIVDYLSDPTSLHGAHKLKVPDNHGVGVFGLFSDI